MRPQHRTWRIRNIPDEYDKQELEGILKDNKALQISQLHTSILKSLRGHPNLRQGLVGYPDIIPNPPSLTNLLKVLNEHPFLLQAIEEHPDLLEILKIPHSNFQIFGEHPYLIQLANENLAFLNLLEKPPDLQFVQNRPHLSNFVKTIRELLAVVKDHKDFLQTLQKFPYLLEVAHEESVGVLEGGVTNGAEIYTLASDLEGSQGAQVATVRFTCIPEKLAMLPRGKQLEIELPDVSTCANKLKRARGPHIVFDDGFEGVTVLKSPSQQEHTVDIFALSGLGSHPFGSFTNKEDGHMWLCESLPQDIPGARVMIYGYDTKLQNSYSFASLSDYAASLQHPIKELLQSNFSSKKPLLLLGHSLGGLVIKETLIRIGQCELNLLDTVCGLVFFGVPNDGLKIESLLPMVKNQPNQPFVESLEQNSRTLAEQKSQFESLIQKQTFNIFCFYEVVESPTAVVDTATNRFEMSGPRECLVSISSATSCLPSITSSNAFPIHRPHSELVKFCRHDAEYRAVSSCLKELVGSLSQAAQQSLEADGTENTMVDEFDIAEEPMLSIAEKEQLLKSLDFHHIDARRETIKKAHAKTCNWLLQNRKYLDWCDTKKLTDHRGFLWIKGKPGAGKSTLMKFCVSKTPKKKNRILTSFFFNARGHDLEKSTEGMYRSILLQLLKRDTTLLAVFDDLGLVSRDLAHHQWTMESLEELLGQAVKRMKNRSLVCFTDALDECDESQIRDMVSFFRQMGELAISAGVEFRVCFSSRHYPHITIQNALELVLETQDGHREDIKQYLHSELHIGHEAFAEQIRLQLEEKASGVFMWVVLVVGILNKEFDVGRTSELQQRIHDLPAELHGLFHDVLLRDEKNKAGLLLCIQWVLFARQPLTPRQLYCAIHSGEDSTLESGSGVDMTEENVKRFILNYSKGLTEVTMSDPPTVQFIHESAPVMNG